MKRAERTTEKSSNRKEINIDPSVYDDPVALSTSWEPLVRGGSTFQTHFLTDSPCDGLVSFRPTIKLFLFCSVFLLGGMGTIAIGVYNFYSQDFRGMDSFIVPSLVGALFACVGLILGFLLLHPFVFDKRQNLFYRGWKRPSSRTFPNKSQTHTHITEIHALQILSEYCRTKNSRFMSYELNLVMKNGERVSVIDHGNLSKLRTDSLSLSRYLEVPLWDSTIDDFTDT